MRQLIYTMFISNNHPSFRLWWKENSVNHLKVSKYYETDCRFKKHKVFPTSAEWKRYRTTQVHLRVERETHEISIRCSIAQNSSGYNPVTKSCILCLLEKLLLCGFGYKDRWINKRLDLVSKCRHENKCMLKNTLELSDFNYVM